MPTRDDYHLVDSNIRVLLRAIKSHAENGNATDVALLADGLKSSLNQLHDLSAELVNKGVDFDHSEYDINIGLSDSPDVA